MRVEKNGIRYFSFAELPTSNNKQSKNKQQNIEELKTKFEKRHKCIVCGKPLTWIPNTNVCACRNPEYSGKKVRLFDGDGNPYEEIRPYFHTIDKVGVSIASKIYS